MLLLLACGQADDPVPAVARLVDRVGEDGCADDSVRMGSLCVDAWEAEVVGELGSPDQFIAPQRKTTATALSKAGVAPSMITYSQAWRACENVGKRLITTSEWEDAADGVVGPGGSAFPYGSEFDPTACATTAEQSFQQYTEVQLTGSKPGCVSEFGAYDLIGNAWEWTASEDRLDIEGWLAANPSYSVVDGLLVGPPAIALAADIEPAQLDQDEQGRLYAAPSQLNKRQAFGRRGYLAVNQRDKVHQLLPFVLEQPDVEGPAYIRILAEADGLPVPIKRGCGYYSGQPSTCTTSRSNLAGHFHDFRGTIGFRCVLDLSDQAAQRP